MDGAWGSQCRSAAGICEDINTTSGHFQAVDGDEADVTWPPRSISTFSSLS